MRFVSALAALLLMPLVASGGALANGCVDQPPLLACPAVAASANAQEAQADATLAVCVAGGDCVSVAAAAACFALVSPVVGACKEAQTSCSATLGCVPECGGPLGLTPCPLPVPHPCPGGSVRGFVVVWGTYYAGHGFGCAYP